MTRTSETGEAPDLSLVVPLFNEERSIPELFRWVNDVTERAGLSFEMILIDDGSKDASWARITELASKDERVKGIRFQKNNGKSAGLNEGFEHVNGQVVITMDGDLQDSPEEIPELYQLVMEEGLDLVSGWKKNRRDPLSKTIPSRLFNWVTRKMSGIPLHDFNCGLKAYRWEVVRNIDVYGEMHRYIPVIAKKEGFDRIGEKVVEHSPRKYGETKFGFERFMHGFLDLATITFVGRFGKKPMHFFGSLGTLMFLVGFAGAAWIGAQKLYYLSQHIPARLVADQPLFYIALVAMIIGTQLFVTGFLAEMVARNSPDRNTYRVREKIGF